MNNRRRGYKRGNIAHNYEKNFVQPQVNTFQTNTALITIPATAEIKPPVAIAPVVPIADATTAVSDALPVVSKEEPSESIAEVSADQESIADVKQDEQPDKMEITEQDGEGTSSSQTFSEFILEKKNGLHKKKSSVIKEKRIRENRRLHKILTPKNALMALNELKADCLSKFNIVGQGTNFNAEIVLNNIRYEGEGTTKAAAKLNASEKAFRDLILIKMAQKQKRDNSKQVADNDSDVVMENDPEEDIPMVHLASFALHKLFSEWESEGYTVPDMRGNAQPSIVPQHNGSSSASSEQIVQPEKTMFIRTELPENYESLHPCMLLSIMRPGQTFEDLGSNGRPGTNTIEHCMGITVDGEKFIANARSKKIARKIAAIEACNKLFGTTFTHDDAA